MTKIFCAIDTADLTRALDLSAAMSRAGCGIKLGMEFFYAEGPQGVRKIRKSHPALPLFLDLKLKDIPHTVEKAALALSSLGADFMTLHATGGTEMMQAARQVLPASIKLLAVTLLTSLDEADITATGMAQKPLVEHVKDLALLAAQAGMDGVVSSAREVFALKAHLPQSFIFMTPGIRLDHANHHDQKRTMTPAEAVKNGASHLVIGRPITEAPDAEKAARAILEQIDF